ncbi:MAG: hypothetical protein R3Y16_01785 [Rikenellaceae bacterium]
MRYLQRSVKYFLALSALYFAMVFVMSLVANTLFTPGDTLRELFSSQRGVFLFVAVIALSLFYPLFGFMRRYTNGDIVKHREQIITSFRLQKMKLHHESDGRMTFVADNMFKRFRLLFEDHVKVVQSEDGKLSVSGNRKAVAYVIYRLEVAVENAELDEIIKDKK